MLFCFVFFPLAAVLSAAPVNMNWTGVQGSNYVPSYAAGSSSTYGTADIFGPDFFDAAVVARELGWMARLQLTSVRVFHTFSAWGAYNASAQAAWAANFGAFLGLASSLHLSVVSSFEWFQQPASCAAASAFIAAIAAVNPHGNVALVEASNEPEVAGGGGPPVSASFLTSCLIPALRAAAGGVPISVAMSSSADWRGSYASVLPLVDVVDWHSYNGGGNGAVLASEIEALRALAGGKQLLLTEILARPSQPLAASLPITRAAGVGVFIWALIFTPGQWWSKPYFPGGPPFQGFLYPNGSAYDEVEEVALLTRPAAGAVVYRAAAFDAGAPLTFAGAWAIANTSCDAAGCEYMQSKGPRLGAAQMTADAAATVAIAVPAGTAVVALYAPRSPAGCAFSVTASPGGQVLATGTSAGDIEWEWRVFVELPQPPPSTLTLALQPPAEGGAFAFMFAGVTFFDAAPPGLLLSKGPT